MTTPKLEEYILIVNSPHKVFIIRFLMIFSFYLGVWIIYSSLPLVSGSKVDGVFVFGWILITVFFLIIPFGFSYKWTRIQLVSVIKKDESLVFRILDKNTIKELEIKLNNLKSHISWTKGRPYSMKLIIFDGEDIVIQLYSAGKRSIEDSFEELHYKIKNEKNS